MQHCCCVPLCSNHGAHRFPRDEALRKKWITAIRKRKYVQNWNPHDSHRLCRKHFKKSDFLKVTKDGTPVVKSRLKPGTIPTIFKWTQTKSKNSLTPKNVTSSMKNKSKPVTSLSSKQLDAKSKNKSKALTSSRSTSFLKSKTATEIPKTARTQTFFAKNRGKIITMTNETNKNELAFSKAKSKSEVSMSKEKHIRMDENQDISNWKYRVIRKESLHLEEILGKIEYVFSLQDFNGRELEEKELEEIISTFPPLKPLNQILPLRSPDHRSLRNSDT